MLCLRSISAMMRDELSAKGALASITSRMTLVSTSMFTGIFPPGAFYSHWYPCSRQHFEVHLSAFG